MKTEAEAKAQALADGILEEQLTPEILAYYGYVPSSPTAGLPVGAVIVSDQVKRDLAALNEEAEANQLPVQIKTQIMGLLGWAKANGLIGMCLCILAMLLVTGCGSSQAARHSTQQAQASVKALNNQHLSFEDRFIQRYETEELARIQALHAKAMASAQTTVTTMEEQEIQVPVKAADGSEAFKLEKRMVPVTTVMVPVNVASALEKNRHRLIKEMKTNVILMRSQQAQICQNAANAVAYLEGLSAYFEQRQLTYESMLAAQKELLNFLDSFVAEKNHGQVIQPPAAP